MKVVDKIQMMINKTEVEIQNTWNNYTKCVEALAEDAKQQRDTAYTSYTMWDASHYSAQAMEYSKEYKTLCEQLRMLRWLIEEEVEG